MKTKTLFPWPGGKTRLAKHLLPLIDERPHTCYVEAFAGSDDGSIALRRTLTGSAQDPWALGEQLAQQLLDDGAGAIVAGVLSRDHTTMPEQPSDRSPGDEGPTKEQTP